MPIDKPDDTAVGDQPFNIDMDLPTTLPDGRGTFVPASTIGATRKVKRSTFLVRMPMLFSRGILIKRLATILLPRHQNIAFLPHTSSTHDKILDHELVPTDDMGISHYIFDERTFTRNRGNRNELKLFECKIQIESPISLYQIKGAQAVMDLLKKHDIYITAKSYCQAVSTKAIGLLMNLDAKRSAKNIIIDNLKLEIDAEVGCDVFMDLVPHRGLVRLGKKVIFGQFLKVMVDIKHATSTAKLIQNGLKNAVFGIRMKNVRLMPVYPIPNLMSAEMFGKMIIAHNDSMYGIAEIQVDNVWDIDNISRLPETIKKRFNLPHGDEHIDDMYTLRDTILPIFWGHFKNEPIIRDVYILRGRLMIVCEKTKVAEATKLVDMLLDFMKNEYDIEHEELVSAADKFADWVGCSTPKNAHRHPARSGTLIFGEGGLLKATVNSFIDGHLDALPSGLVPAAGNAEKKPDLSRPPPTALLSRGRTRPNIDPTEFTASAVNAWASAKSWASVTKSHNNGGGKKNQSPQFKPVPAKAIIEIDNATNSTVPMTSGTQAALEAMRQSVQKLDLDRKENRTKIETLDNTMAQIARDVTALSDSQRQSNSEYMQIKEQILNIAKDNGDIRKDMIEMKDMIMCIATHLGGVRSDQVTPTTPTPPQTQYQTQSQGQQFGPSQLQLHQIQDQLKHRNHHLNGNTSTQDIKMMNDGEKVDDDDTPEDNRKKLKQHHVQVFDIQAEAANNNNRANHPPLVQNALAISNGSDGDHSIDEVDLTSMYD